MESSRSRLYPLLKFLLPFSSAPSIGQAEESVAHLQSMLRRPETIRPRSSLWNSCSFIGTVARPVKRYGGRYRGLGAYTFLEVKTPSRGSNTSPPPPPPFQILLAMQNKLAEVAVKYLKPNDFIYVHGLLGSYGKANGSRKHEIFYKVSKWAIDLNAISKGKPKVFVEELNYVGCTKENQTSKKPKTSDFEELTALASGCAFDQDRASLSSIVDGDVLCKDRLHLWQLFFANPNEWWDNRNRKLNSRSPDFKHKDTQECLWLNPRDPPWVRKQLQLYDSKLAEAHHMNLGWKPYDHEWKLKDFV